MDIQLTPRPWYRKYLWHIIAAMAFLGVLIYTATLAFRPKSVMINNREFKISEASDAHFTEYVNVEGIVKPIQTIKVNALESGFVERIVAEEGAMLNVGDTILILMNPDLTRTLEDEQSNWQNSERNYREQEIEMEQKSIVLRQQALDARHQISSLEKKLRQSREEFKMGIKSKAELEVIEEDFQYQLRRTELQMESLRHDSTATILKRDMIEANRTANNKKLDRCNQRTANLVVRATVAGQLSFLNATIGQQISAGNSVCEIKVLSEFKISTALSEYYIDRISTGQQANIKYQDQLYPLRISKVVPEIKNKTFDCDLVFTGEKPSNIRLGKSYTIQVELGQTENAILIDRGDFYATTFGNWIYRLSADGTRAEKVSIEIGRQNPKQYEILSGLNPGDRVIISGYDKLGNKEEFIIKN